MSKTLKQLVAEFDDEQFLLRRDLHALRDDHAVVRTIAGRLRTLICRSSSVEGLLWRLCEALDVSDEIPLICPQSVNRDHPLNNGLAFEQLTFCRPEYAPPAYRAQIHSLKDVIKTCEPFYVPALFEMIRNKSLSHEWLIKQVAEQVGISHVDDGVSPPLRRLLDVSVNGYTPIIRTLAFDSELTLQVGERVLDAAENTGLYRRVRRGSPNGDVSIASVIEPRRDFVGAVRLRKLRSHISEIDFGLRVLPTTFCFTLSKRGTTIGEFKVSLPSGRSEAELAGIAFLYSSNSRRARFVTTGEATPGTPFECDAGWIEQREITWAIDGVDDSGKISSCFHRANVGILSGHVSPDQLRAIVTDPNQVIVDI